MYFLLFRLWWSPSAADVGNPSPLQRGADALEYGESTMTPLRSPEDWARDCFLMNHAKCNVNVLHGFNADILCVSCTRAYAAQVRQETQEALPKWMHLIADEELEARDRRVRQEEQKWWRNLFIWMNGEPYYATENRVPQSMPKKIAAAIRAREP